MCSGCCCAGPWPWHRGPGPAEQADHRQGRGRCVHLPRAALRGAGLGRPAPSYPSAPQRKRRNARASLGKNPPDPFPGQQRRGECQPCGPGRGKGPLGPDAGYWIVPVETARHSAPAMQSRLFLPTARQTNWLLLVGLLSLGEALYLRYLAMSMRKSRWPAKAASAPGYARRSDSPLGCTTTRCLAGSRSVWPRSIWSGHRLCWYWSRCRPPHSDWSCTMSILLAWPPRC